MKPGIYDLKIIEGAGNIFGERFSKYLLMISEIAGDKSNEPVYRSKIRMIIFEGDTLEFLGITKVKFHAVPEKIEPSNELGVGDFIVGRDILQGN